MTAEWVVDKYGEKYLEEHAPALIPHEPGKPGGPTNLPDVSNIPPTGSSCRICVLSEECRIRQRLTLLFSAC